MESVPISQAYLHLQAATGALHRAKQAVSLRSFSQANTHCKHVLDSSQQFMIYSSRGDSELNMKMIDLLMDCSHFCNSLMQHNTAMTCYSLAINLAVNHVHSNTLALRLCEAISAMVHMNLLLQKSESAYKVISKYGGYLIDLDLQEPNDQIKACLGNMYLDVGLALYTRNQAKGIYSLEKGRQYFIGMTDNPQVQRYAHLLSALGQGCLQRDQIEQGLDHLTEALGLWKKLGYPPEDCRIILNTMTALMQSELVHRNHMESFCGSHTHRDLLELHKFSKLGLGMGVAEALTDLGKIASHHMHYKEAIVYFSEALQIYQNQSSSSALKITNILKLSGITYFNNKQYEEAVRVYRELLCILHTIGDDKFSNVSLEAECCASLGLSYSRLQDFNNMLKFYDQALKLKMYLDVEDLERIQIKIGYLYFIKAVLLEQDQESSLAHKYNMAAEHALIAALRYSWKSLPFINYGYYLMYHGHYQSSVGTFQQAYLNAVIDQDVKEIDNMEYPILLEDLRTELQDQKHLLIPASILALYLKSMVQLKMKNISDAKGTVCQLEQEIQSTNFDYNFSCSCGGNEMKASSYSLLAYLHRELYTLEKAKKHLKLLLN